MRPAPPPSPPSLLRSPTEISSDAALLQQAMSTLHATGGGAAAFAAGVPAGRHHPRGLTLRGFQEFIDAHGGRAEFEGKPANPGAGPACRTVTVPACLMSL